jgi:hypothetical protein
MLIAQCQTRSTNITDQNADLNQHFKKKKLKRKIHSFEINSFL